MFRNILLFLIGAFVGGVGVFFFLKNTEKAVTLPVTSVETHEAMTMDEMVANLESKQGDEFDAEFLEGMILHHIGAIEMAKIATLSAGHIEIKDMAQDILRVQSLEVEQMRAWQDVWGYNNGHSYHE